MDIECFRTFGEWRTHSVYVFKVLTQECNTDEWLARPQQNEGRVEMKEG